MNFKNDMDYVLFYAEKLKNDNSFFLQQKMLVESQMKSSFEIFKNKFGKGASFKKDARVYLKNMKLI